MERAHYGMQRHMGMVRKQRGETKGIAQARVFARMAGDRAEEMAYNLII